MKILLTGGTGFIGSFLTTRLILDGHKVSVLTRDEKFGKAGSTDFFLVPGDPSVPGSWQQSIKNYDAIINLAGASIFSRWTAEQKKLIREQG